MRSKLTISDSPFESNGPTLSALDNAELQELETIATQHDLTNIVRLCMEVRHLRHAYLTQAAKSSRLEQQVRMLEPSARNRYSAELDTLCGRK